MLPRLTPKQRQRANALIKRLCANYDNGNCLALDDGEPCACVQSISYSLLCKYFRKAVLPAEPLLEVDILGTRFEKCVSCGAPIIKKALCGQSTERLNLADTEGHRRIQSVKLLKLENTELAKVLSRCGKQSLDRLIHQNTGSGVLCFGGRI